jgi:hypothetical protein
MNDTDIIIQNIAKNYTRYLAIKKILLLCSHKNYQISVALMLYDMANNIDREHDEIFIIADKDETCYSHILYIKKKSNYTYEYLYTLINKIRKIILKFIQMKEYKMPKTYGFFDYYYCDDIIFNISNNTIEKLKRAIDKKYNEISDLIILNCLLRYGMLLNYYELTFSDKFYEILYKNHIKIEGLSSPFNCMLLEYDNKIRFCSLFYDTDKYFGSMGNLFNIDIDKLKNKYIYLNASSHGLFYKTTKFVYDNIDNNINFLLILYSVPADYERSKYFYLLKDSPKCNFYRQLSNIKVYNRYQNYTYFTNVVHIFNFGIKINMKDIISTITDNNNKFVDITEEEKIMLCKEYYRLNTSTNIFKLYDVSNHEWKNIVERFLNDIANYNDNSSNIIFKKIPGDHYIYKKLLDEMTNKYIKNPGEILKQVYNIVNEYNEHNLDISTCESFSLIGSVFYYKNNMFDIQKNVLRKLLNKIKIYMKTHENKNINDYSLYILIMLMRYNTMLAGSQHWNIPYNYYKYINKMYNVKVEGFSSPLNSQLLLIDDNSFFCSLFYDVDKYFGSIGSFFNTDMIKFYDFFRKKHGDYLSFSLNPPYIESLIVEMTKVVDNCLNIIPKIRFFIGLPYWSNFEPIDNISKNKYLKYVHIFNKGTYYYEGNYGNINTQIYTTGKSKYIFWVLSNFDILQHEKEYDSIIKYFDPSTKF